jgi:PAS domain S-box-containing protein
MKQTPLDQLTPSSLELAYKTFFEHFQALGNSPDEQARSVKMELEDIRKDNSKGWSEINTTFLRSPEGSFSGIVGVSRDITERKRLEEELKRYRDHLEELVAQRTDELRKSNEDLQREITQRKRAENALREERDFSTSLIQTSPTFFVALSSELKTLMMNDTMLKELGYEKAEALGTNYLETFIPESDHELIVQSFENLVGSQEPILIESHVLTKDGRKLLVEWHSRQLLKENGEIDSFFGVGIEISERKKAEKALRESEERYERAERIGHFGHWDGDFMEDWNVWSEETYRIFGIDPAKFKPTYKAFLNFVHPEDREKLERTVQPLIKQGGEIDVEYRIIRPDGQVRFIHSVAEVHLDKNGKPWKSLGMLHDITERKRMEQEITKVQQLESLGILAGGIAHDFNNILTAILANISMVKLYGDLQDDISQMLTEAEKASLRAKKLTQQLLTFAKGGAPIRKAMSISGLLKDTAEFTLSGSKARCEFSMPDDLWLIKADAGQIGQVIQNLIINADQAMPRGGTIKICAENAIIGENDVPLLKEGRYLKISVTDQGTGIAKKDLSSIFDPFFTTKQKGSGLGLATAFSIVNNHDGHISVDSEVEVGTTFHVYLPSSRKTSRPEERAKDEPTRGKGRILLIDDEEIIRRATGEVLKRIGYQVKVAKDHEDGIRRYDKALKGKRPFDVIIMDLTIPGDLGAREAIKKFKEIDRDVRVIVSSGYSDDPTMSNYREYGFRGVVEKPYNIGDLAEVLHTVLGRA